MPGPNPLTLSTPFVIFPLLGAVGARLVPPQIRSSTMASDTLKAAVLMTALASCTSTDPLDWRLSDGSPLTSLATPDSASSVVLIVDPSDPFSCWRTLSEWNEWRRETGQHYSVVLSREATPPERRRLLAIGVRGAPVLKRGTLRAAHTPVELMFAADTVRFFAYRVRVPDSPLLQALREEHAEELSPQKPPESIRSRSDKKEERNE